MIRGTTPTHTFNIPFDTNLLSEVRVIYAQSDKVLFTKNNDDCTMNGNSISVTLTQHDTFKFDASKEVQIQLRVLTAAGEVLSSGVEIVGIAKCLDDEVLV